MRTNVQDCFKGAALAVLIAVASVSSGVLRAQAPEGPDTSSSTTEDSTGTVTGVTAHETISVDSRRGPFTYRLGRDLHVVGPNGKAMEIQGVHVGQKVTVYYYMRDGQATVARIAVLEEAPKKDK
jgi:hypothetical protein